ARGESGGRRAGGSSTTHNFEMIGTAPEDGAQVTTRQARRRREREAARRAERLNTFVETFGSVLGEILRPILQTIAAEVRRRTGLGPPRAELSFDYDPSVDVFGVNITLVFGTEREDRVSSRAEIAGQLLIADYGASGQAFAAAIREATAKLWDSALALASRRASPIYAEYDPDAGF